MKQSKELLKKRTFYIVGGILVICVFVVFAITYFYSDDVLPKEKIKHNIDMEPAPLKEEEKTESVVGYGAKGALSDDDLTITDMLTYAVQDEYLAHGEYQSIINKFGSQRPYSNIILSEETHLSYLKEIYKSYDIEFPSDSSSSHIVVPNSLLEAAQTGVQAEIDNINMYEKFLTHELPDSVKGVFTILRDGSKKHLNAFQNQVNKLSR